MRGPEPRASVYCRRHRARTVAKRRISGAFTQFGRIRQCTSAALQQCSVNNTRHSNGMTHLDLQCCCPDTLVWCKTCDSGKQDDQECGDHLIVKPPDCLCSDVPAQGGPTRTTCAEQYNVGNCGQAFLKDSIKDIPEGEKAVFFKDTS